MKLRLLALAAALCLACTASAHAFFKLALPATWPQEEGGEAPSCPADRGLATLEAMLVQNGIREDHVLRLSGQDARDYLAGVKEVFGADLGDADLLVIVEVERDGAEPIEVVFAFKDGCFLYKVGATKSQHQQVLGRVKESKARTS